MKFPRRQNKPQAPQADPRLVAVFQRTASGFEALIASAQEPGAEIVAMRRFDAGDAAAGEWVGSQLAARCVVCLPSADVIVRAVQLPAADEGRLESALQLNATTFILGRTPSWRVGAALLPRERGERIRTGIIAEWPADDRIPEVPAGLPEGFEPTFAPGIAALAALSAAAEGPLVSVDAERGAVTICAPTSRGLLARVVRAGGEGAAIEESDVLRAVGEACVHAGVPADEIPLVLAQARDAAAPALGGGFGCMASDLPRLCALVRGAAARPDAQWWREHGLLAGTALAACDGATALTALRSGESRVRADRVASLLNRVAEPRTARRILVASLLTIALGPLAFEGARLLVLRWKLPDLQAYRRAEETEKKKQALYRVLSRHSASMLKSLSDLACTAPDGVEVDFVNIAQGPKGQAVTVRGRARGAGGQQSSEVILAMEEQMRETGAFENIVRNSELPSQQGYQEFTISAVAVKPTMRVAFKPGQDFEAKSMRERRYGAPPADVDRVASGLDPVEGDGGAASGAGKAGAGAGSASGSRTAQAEHGETDGAAGASGAANGNRSGSGTAVASATPPAGGEHASAREGSSRRGAGSAGSSRGSRGSRGAGGAADAAHEGDTATAGAAHESGAPATATPGAPATATPGSPAGPEGAAGESGGSRAARAGGAGSGRFATRGGGVPGGSNEPEPPPAPMTAAEINAMSKEEARAALVVVSRQRSRADLDEAVRARLKSEFDLLLERCKRD